MSVTTADRDASSTWMYFAGSGGLPAPLPWIGSQAAASRTMTAVKTPPKMVLWWERLEVWQQLAISFPVFAVLTFLLNIGPFGQAILRSVFYGLFEGGVLSGLLAVATRTERDRRRS
jgi:hypothetical protein